MVINSPEGLSQLENGNRFIGSPPQMKDSKVLFTGKNNIFYCEPGVVLNHCNIMFHDDDAVLVLGRSKSAYMISLSLYKGNVCYFGRDCYFNGTFYVVASERKHFFVGNDGLFSFGIWVRPADLHLIYDCESKRRLNPSKSIFLGDHVWVGQSALLLKGTRIDSGSIVGAMSVVSGKHIPHNTAWAGNPARQISENVFWDGSCMHIWTKDMTETSMNYRKFAYLRGDRKADDHVYAYDAEKSVSFEEMDRLFDDGSTDEKLEFLKKLLEDETKNRFVHAPEKGRGLSTLLGKKRS